MAQISKGDTFTNGEQVTGARLNQLVDSSTLLTGAITEQGALTAATVASDDLVLISDTSASALRKATVNDILGSSLPITASSVTATSVVTSVVNAVANSDILITPNDGTNVTSKTFSSGDGITATVASTAHGLVTGQNVTITASNSAYSGTYKITVTTVDAFTYVLVPTTTAASGTCSYVREGSVRINGELNVSAGLNIAGATTLGATSVTSLTIGGKTPMTTQDNLLKVYVKSGFTTGITAGGSTESTIYTLPALGTIPSDETWTYEFYVMLTAGYMYDATRPVSDLPELLIYNGSTLVTSFQGSTGVYGEISSTFIHSLVGVSSATYSLRYKSVGALREDPRYLIRLTKVKTSTLSDASSCI
jgi:hypothetical protein